MTTSTTAYKPISADSHVTEPPNCYLDHIEPSFRDRAPHVVETPAGDTFVIHGMATPVPMGLVGAAGRDPQSMRQDGAFYKDAVNLHLGGWDPVQRLADQDVDGVGAELLYPTVGMLLCNHPDYDYKHACFQAYNRWMQGYCSSAPDRLHGLAQTAMRSVDEGIADLSRAKEMGFVGMMLPGDPAFEDYDHPAYDVFYEAAADLDMPLSFHILTGKADELTMRVRGPALNLFMASYRGCQDIAGMFVFSRVFERHPRLRVVLVEADVGWAPHFMYRMDHGYRIHRHHMNAEEMRRMPSEYFQENIRLTFQDDWIAFQAVKQVGAGQFMWANDFPHTDATWPHSQELLDQHAVELTPAERRAVLHDNVADLYGLAS